MYSRVVRFTDVDPDRINALVARIEAADGPPPGVDSTGMKLIHDASNATAVFIAYFATEEAMRAADEVMQAMDSSETPGTRQSIDQGEVLIERDA